MLCFPAFWGKLFCVKVKFCHFKVQRLFNFISQGSSYMIIRIPIPLCLTLIIRIPIYLFGFISNRYRYRYMFIKPIPIPIQDIGIGMIGSYQYRYRYIGYKIEVIFELSTFIHIHVFHIFRFIYLIISLLQVVMGGGAYSGGGGGGAPPPSSPPSPHSRIKGLASQLTVDISSYSHHIY